MQVSKLRSKNNFAEWKLFHSLGKKWKIMEIKKIGKKSARKSNLKWNADIFLTFSHSFAALHFKMHTKKKNQFTLNYHLMFVNWNTSTNQIFNRLAYTQVEKQLWNFYIPITLQKNNNKSFVFSFFAPSSVRPSTFKVCVCFFLLSTLDKLEQII